MYSVFIISALFSFFTFSETSTLDLIFKKDVLWDNVDGAQYDSPHQEGVKRRELYFEELSNIVELLKMVDPESQLINKFLRVFNPSESRKSGLHSNYLKDSWELRDALKYTILLCNKEGLQGQYIRGRRKYFLFQTQKEFTKEVQEKRAKFPYIKRVYQKTFMNLNYAVLTEQPEICINPKYIKNGLDLIVTVVHELTHFIEDDGFSDLLPVIKNVEEEPINLTQIKNFQHWKELYLSKKGGEREAFQSETKVLETLDLLFLGHDNLAKWTEIRPRHHVDLEKYNDHLFESFRTQLKTYHSVLPVIEEQIKEEILFYEKEMKVSQNGYGQSLNEKNLKDGQTRLSDLKRRLYNLEENQIDQITLFGKKIELKKSFGYKFLKLKHRRKRKQLVQEISSLEKKIKQWNSSTEYNKKRFKTSENKKRALLEHQENIRRQWNLSNLEKFSHLFKEKKEE